MKLFYALLFYCISCCCAIPVQQQPLRSGAELDWKDANCYPGSSGNGNNTICIQQVFDPIIDGDILGSPRIDQFCGYMPLSTAANPVKLFFWVVLSEGNPAKDPVVLWMNGGPGSTSLYGLLDQWGPRLVDHTKRPAVKFTDNSFRTTEKMTWVFLEQPSATGYSTGRPNVDDSKTAAKDISTFIKILFSKDTKFNYKGKKLTLTKQDLHIAGESFAGHWIPALGSYMVGIGQHTAVRLKSVMIGNGVTDAALMGDAMSALVCTRPPPLTLPGARPVDVQTRCGNMAAWKIACDAAIRDCRGDKTLCGNVFGQCLESWGPGWAPAFHRDIYDVNNDELSRTQSRGFFKNEFAQFMNDPGRRTRLGVTGGPIWQPGNSLMITAFGDSGDWFKNYIPEVQNILNAKIDVLLFAGDQDLMCPFTLTRATALNTDWNEAGKRDKFRKCAARPESTYKTISLPPSLPYAHYIRAGRLMYARVFKVGHMINGGKAREAKHLFETWILNRPTLVECDPGP